MLGIEKEETFVLVDTNHHEMQATFEAIIDKVVAQVAKLVNFTGIGSNLKF